MVDVNDENMKVDDEVIGKTPVGVSMSGTGGSSKKETSNVWRYFTRIEKDKDGCGKAVCNLCGNGLSVGKNPKSGVSYGTSHLKRHAATCKRTANSDIDMAGMLGNQGRASKLIKISQKSQRVVVTHTGTGTSQGQKMANVDVNIQEGSNLTDKEGELGVVSDGSNEVHPKACADTQSSHSLIIAELGAFKHSGDLDDAQIDLLAEPMAAYPHLWKALDKFSMRFQALMLKTLADMLFFLRNESAASVTPQQEREFLQLCDEAVQLGFDKSWVDEMRQRIMVGELLKMHGQLTQELRKIKDKIDNLHHLIDSQKKCYDFL